MCCAEDPGANEPGVALAIPPRTSFTFSLLAAVREPSSTVTRGS
jgi:hypothetical protein